MHVNVFSFFMVIHEYEFVTILLLLPQKKTHYLLLFIVQTGPVDLNGTVQCQRCTEAVTGNVYKHSLIISYNILQLMQAQIKNFSKKRI